VTLKEAYKILGVSKENTDREIKAKYKKLLIMYHPDSDPTRKRDPEDDEKIRQVIEACKEVMTDHDFTPAHDKVKDIFHLMMQEYVLPADAARKIGKMIREDGDREVYSFSGFIKDEPGTRRESKINCGEPLNIYLREDRAVVEVNHISSAASFLPLSIMAQAGYVI